ncbi:MAG: ATPase [Mycoplasmataceae bacterium RC_NB112A]|nr:MAG: ATPase [Mycoplasmataceae bacterium RC_NB112A]
MSQFLLPFLSSNIYLILEGELGVGKTTLTQLIAKNLGIEKKITSPTFNILQRYQIKSEYYLNHFDFFRLKNTDNLNFFQELATDNLNIIEWPEKNPSFWKNEKYIRLKLTKRQSVNEISDSKQKKDQTRELEIDFSKLTDKDLNLNTLKKFLTTT